MDVLRHIQIHGSRGRKEICKSLPEPHVGKTLDNLCTLGYLSRDPSTEPASYVLTNKGRIRLATPYLKQAVIQPPKPRAPRVKKDAPAPVPMNIVQTTGCTDFLRDEAGNRRFWPVWVKRGADDSAYRPNDNTYKPTEYAPCTRPGSMVAFSLPSRIGGRLFYRDGQVTDLAGNPQPQK